MGYYFVTPIDGLYLEDIASDGSEPMTLGASLLYDSALWIPASPTNDYWYYHYAYGLDLGAVHEVNRIICFDHLYSIGWHTSAHDSVKVFKSNDNVTWTFVEQFDAPTRTYGRWELTLASPSSARYWKVFNCESASTLGAPTGISIKVTEIEIYTTTFLFELSGTVKEKGSGVSRTVRSYIRSTGELFDSTVSEADGSFSIAAPDTTTEMFVVAFDDDAGDQYNALIFDRVKGLST